MKFKETKVTQLLMSIIIVTIVLLAGCGIAKSSVNEATIMDNSEDKSDINKTTAMESDEDKVGVNQPIVTDANNEKYLYLIKDNNKYGFIDENGNTIVEPQYEYASDFSQGYAVISYQGSYGYIDGLGQVVIQPQYELALNFSEGLATVQINGKWGYINEEGKLAIEPQFDSAESFSEGKAAVSVGRKIQYINKKGEKIIEVIGEVGFEFKESYAVIENAVSGKVYSQFINEKGEFVFQKYGAADSFSDGLAVVMTGDRYEGEDNLYGYINGSGNIVIEQQFVGAMSFSEGVAAIYDGVNWRYINQQKENIFDRTFESAQSFSEGLAGVRQDGKWGFINKSGEDVIKAQYDNVEAFKHGLAKVLKNGKWMYIDTDNKCIWEQKLLEKDTYKQAEEIYTSSLLKFQIIIPNSWEGLYKVKENNEGVEFLYSIDKKIYNLFLISTLNMDEWKTTEQYMYTYLGERGDTVYVSQCFEGEYSNETEKGKRIGEKIDELRQAFSIEKNFRIID